MRKRRSRKNAFWGRPRLHSKAARKGWGRRRARRSRRNAGAMSLVKNTTRSIGAGFNTKVLKRAGTILGGNVLTTWSEGMIGSRVPFLRSHPVAEILSLLVLASAAGVATAKTGLRKYINPADIMIGGMLAGITRGAKLLFPGSFSTCGLGEDMDGLADGIITTGMPLINTHGGWAPYPHMGIGAYASPQTREIMAGMGASPGPRALAAGVRDGIGDYGMPVQVHPNLLDGMANAEVSNEIGFQM